MITEHDPVLADLARYQDRIDTDVGAKDVSPLLGALADAVEARADELLEDAQFIYDFLGDVEQGGGLKERAVMAVVRAVTREMKKDPALAHRYRRMALKEAREQIKAEAQRYA